MARKNYSRRKTQQRKRKTTKQKNIFRGADDIYLTDRSIAVRRVSTVKSRNGRAVLRDKTTYVPKTEKNLRRAKEIYGYLRNGRT